MSGSTGTIVTVLLGVPTLYMAWRALVWARRGAIAAEAQAAVATTDTTMRIGFIDEQGGLSDKISVEGGTRVNLAITNLGGSRSPPADVHISVGPQLTVRPTGKWQPYARPNADMPAGTVAWRVDIPAVATHEKVRLPPIVLDVPEGASRVVYLDPRQVPFNRRIRWEVWFGSRGGNSGDLFPVVRPTS